MKRINLLPKLKQRELGYERTLYSLSVAVAAAAIIMIIGVLVQFGVWTYLNRKIKTSEAEIEQLKSLASKSENAAVKEEIKKVNAQINDFTALTYRTPQWSTVLAALVKNVPESVKITQFDIDPEKKDVTINGFSPSRDLVIDLYNNINADKEHFANIDYPLENVTQPTNVRFHFTFSIAEGVLIKPLPK